MSFNWGLNLEQTIRLLAANGLTVQTPKKLFFEILILTDNDQNLSELSI